MASEASKKGGEPTTWRLTPEELRTLKWLCGKGRPYYIGSYPYDGYEEAKANIFEMRGYVCQRCGATPESLAYYHPALGVVVKPYSSFVVHHKNRNPMDQRWVNLEVLCQRCHRARETHAQPRAGPGSTGRRARYAAP